MTVRNTIAIVLIGLLLMNVMGYYGVFLGLEIRNESAMMHRLDADDFEAQQVVSIKIPVSIPYAADAAEFERAEGKFKHDGKIFRLLKQRYAKDTLTIICVKDVEAQKIDQALSAYVKTFADNQQNTSHKISITLIKDYIPSVLSIQTDAAWVVECIRQNDQTTNLSSSFVTSILHPPEIL